MRVLHVTSSLDCGGIASLLYEYCTRMMPEVQFDFVVSSSKEGIIERKLLNLGCNVYHLPRISANPRLYLNKIRSIIENGDYQIVHSHCDFKSYFELKIAKKCGVKVRIAHCHRANQSVSLTDHIVQLIFTPLTKCVCTHLFACGKDAAIWAWGNTAYKNSNVFIMKNAIETKNYEFSSLTRSEFRKYFGIDDKYVIGNVARLSYAKNHEFLLDIFSE